MQAPMDCDHACEGQQHRPAVTAEVVCPSAHGGSPPVPPTVGVANWTGAVVAGGGAALLTGGGSTWTTEGAIGATESHDSPFTVRPLGQLDGTPRQTRVGATCPGQQHVIPSPKRTRPSSHGRSSHDSLAALGA